MIESLFAIGQLAVRERRGFTRVYDLPERLYTPAQLTPIEDADAIMVYHTVHVSRRVIERLQRCRLIIRCGVGYDNVDHACAAQRGIPVVEFNPNEVKVAVTGYGRADKGQVQRMVQALLGLAVLPRPDHAADALAVAICAAHGRGPG
mgnify:CR=1 FL=1